MYYTHIQWKNYINIRSRIVNDFHICGSIKQSKNLQKPKSPTFTLEVKNQRFVKLLDERYFIMPSTTN